MYDVLYSKKLCVWNCVRTSVKAILCSILCVRNCVHELVYKRFYPCNFVTENETLCTKLCVITLCTNLCVLSLCASKCMPETVRRCFIVKFVFHLDRHRRVSGVFTGRHSLSSGVSFAVNTRLFYLPGAAFITLSIVQTVKQFSVSSISLAGNISLAHANDSD